MGPNAGVDYNLTLCPLQHIYHRQPFAGVDFIPQSEAARICKRLWSPGIDSEESISPAYVAWRASTTNRVSYRPARLRIDTWSP
jgi:hypothetical protein